MSNVTLFIQHCKEGPRQGQGKEGKEKGKEKVILVGREKYNSFFPQTIELYMLKILKNQY